MSKLTKKVVNGKVQFLHLGKRINASEYYKLKYELSKNSKKVFYLSDLHLFNIDICKLINRCCLMKLKMFD